MNAVISSILIRTFIMLGIFLWTRSGFMIMYFLTFIYRYFLKISKKIFNVNFLKISANGISFIQLCFSCYSIQASVLHIMGGFLNLNLIILIKLTWHIHTVFLLLGTWVHFDAFSYLLCLNYVMWSYFLT